MFVTTSYNQWRSKQENGHDYPGWLKFWNLDLFFIVFLRFQRSSRDSRDFRWRKAHKTKVNNDEICQLGLLFLFSGSDFLCLVLSEKDAWRFAILLHVQTLSSWLDSIFVRSKLCVIIQLQTNKSLLVHLSTWEYFEWLFEERFKYLRILHNTFVEKHWIYV
jgi:hypothetical protein